MATTIVRKGQNRKAAEAKRARAAQKTPLPGDAVTEQVQDALSDNLDTFGMPELRQLAKAKGVTVPFGAKKTAIVALLRGESTKATEAAPAGGAIKRGTPAHLKVPQFDPKASAKQDAENREKFSKLQREIGARLVEERKRFGRAKLAALVGITPSQIWRCEAPQSRGRLHEIEMIQAVFARIDSGELVPPEKPKPFGGKTGGASKAKTALDEIEHVLTSVPVKSNVTQLRAAVSAALELIEKARA